MYNYSSEYTDTTRHRQSGIKSVAHHLLRQFVGGTPSLVRQVEISSDKQSPFIKKDFYWNSMVLSEQVNEKFVGPYDRNMRIKYLFIFLVLACHSSWNISWGYKFMQCCVIKSQVIIEKGPREPLMAFINVQIHLNCQEEC